MAIQIIKRHTNQRHQRSTFLQGISYVSYVPLSVLSVSKTTHYPFGNFRSRIPN